MAARYGFLTIRAHEAEPDLFEKILIIFFPLLANFKEFAYNVECDDTPAKHIHCFFTLDKSYRDAEKITNEFLKNKPLKKLKQQFGQTIWKACWKMKMVPHTKEDELKTLGYCVKESGPRKKIQGYSPQHILEAINYYILTQRLDKHNPLDNDWKYITTKNIHQKITQFCKENNKTLHDYDIKEQMSAHKTSWVQISLKQYNLALAELRYENNKCEDSRLMIKSHGSPCMEEIERLQEQISTLESKLTILHIQHSTLKNSKTKTIIRTHPPEDYLKLKEFYNKYKHLETKD